ncbi:MAG: Ig-like domain repeat protein, partial [Actinomycetota bacterium]
MDFRRNWVVLALIAAVGVGGAVAGSERGIGRNRAPRRPVGIRRQPANPISIATDPPFHWTQQLDGQAGADDFANSVAFDSNGNVAAAGVITDPNGAQRFTVAKFSPRGDVLWVRTLTGLNANGDNAANAVAFDNQGNVAAAGHLDNGNGFPDADFAVMKWKANGDPLWSAPQTFDGGVNGDDSANSIAVDSVGNVIAVGYHQISGGEINDYDFVAMKFAGSDGVRSVFYTRGGSDASEDEARCVAVEYDAVKAGSGVQEDFVVGGFLRDDNQWKFYVVKLNGGALSPGEMVRWEYAPENNVEGDASAESIAIDGGQNVVAGGYLDNGEGTGHAVVKLAGATGTPVWADTPPTARGIATYLPVDSYGSYLSALAIDASGDIVTTGVSYGEGTGDLTVVKFLGADGTTQFSNRINGDPFGSSAGYDIAVLPNNFMVVVGSIDLGGSQGQGDFGTFVALKLDPGGNQVWKRSLNGGGADFDSAYSVAVDGAGNIVAAGDLGSPSLGDRQFVVAYVDQFAPAVRFLQATPNMLPPTGGEANIAAEIQENVDTAYVSAEITAPGGGSEIVPLTREIPFSPNFPAEFWSARYQFPANAGSTPATYNIKILTGDVNGNNGFGGAEQVVVDSDSVTPTITLCEVTPNYFSYAGGSTLIAADVTDNVGVDHVEAKVLHPDGITGSIVPLELTTGNRYEGTFDVPANSGSEPEFYDVDISAADAAGNSTNTFCNTIQVDMFDGTAPVLSNCDVTPRNVPRTGAMIALSCNADDNVEVSIVKAEITRPDEGTDVVFLEQTPDTNQFSGQYSVPANAVNAPQQYSVTFFAEDLQGNADEEPCGDITIASADAEQPNIVQCSVTPNFFDHQGGAALISADVTDNVGVQRVEAKVLLPDGFTTIIVPLELVSGNRFEGSFNTLPNSGSEPEFYDVDLEAEDAAGNLTNSFCDTILVDSQDVSPPVLSDCQVTPRNLPSSGGSVSLSAAATDNRDLVLVQAVINLPGGGTDTVVLTQAGMSDTYTGSYQAASNSTNAPKANQDSFAARDAEGNTAQEPCGVFTVASDDDEAPIIATCAVSPDVVSPSGGPVQVTADVTDPSGLASVQARIVRPDGGVNTVSMPLISGSSYAGVFAAPANQSAQDAVYTVFIVARDTSGNTSVLRCGTVTVLSPDVDPPSLTGARVSPPYRSAAGGAFSLEVQATDNRGVAEVAE